MSEFGRPYKTTEESLEDLVSGVDMVIDTLQQGLGDIFDSLQETLGGVGKEFSSSNTRKSMGSLEKFGKSLKAAPQLFILEQLMKLLEPFMQLLEPIATLFDVLAGLFSVFTAEATKGIYEVLQPLFDLLIDLMPVFKILGSLFAGLIKIGFVPLQIIIELLSAVLKPLIPLFEKLEPIFDAITPILSILINIGLLPLVATLYGVARAIATIVDLITGILDSIDFLNLTPIRGTAFGAEVDKLFLPIMGSLIGLQTGGLVKDEGIFRLAEKEPEVVTPYSEFKKMMQPAPINEEHFVDMNDKLETLIQIQQKQARTMGRRRFG